MEDGTPPERPRAQRSDAVRSREAILRAARELFSETPEVSMLAVSKRAGVGQATLYRHFPDRVALAEVLFAEVSAEFNAAVDAAGDGPEALERILAASVDLTIRMHGFVALVREGSGDSGRGDVTRPQLAALLKEPLARAQAGGRVRTDVELDEVVAITRMIEGGLADETDAAVRRRRGARLFDLVLRGMRP